MNRVGFVFGLAFGFLIAGARLNDYNVIHSMLRLQEPDVFLLLGSAVLVAAPLLRILQSRGVQTPLGGRLCPSPSGIERKHILGSVVFGTGWAVAGTCPAPALAMAGEGGLLGAVVVTGLFVGLMLRDTVVSARETARVEQRDPNTAPVGL